MGKLAIWVPGERRHGLGHYFRNVFIYEEVDNAFFFFNGDVQFTPDLHHMSFRSDDPSAIYDFLKQNNVKALIIDHYFLSPLLLSYFEKVEDIKVFNFKNSAADYGFYCNFNNSIYYNENHKLSQKSQLVFCGPEYYGFRKKIVNTNKGLAKQDSVLICFGGTDPLFLSGKIIRYLPQDKQYVFVLGPGCQFSYRDELDRTLNLSGLKYELFYNPENIYELMARSQKAIVGLGTIIYELIYLGKPFIAFYTAQNQERLRDYLMQEFSTPILNEHNASELYELIKSDNFSKISLNIGEKKAELINAIKSTLEDK